MRINRFVAAATGMSRRAADKLASTGEIYVNGHPVKPGQEVTEHDVVTSHQKVLALPKTQTIMLNKPPGYVCSRNGQGSRTIYDLLPEAYHTLKPIGRLDKDSSGLLLLTNDGKLANGLTHPSHNKTKIYEITLDKTLVDEDKHKIEQGIMLEDGRSALALAGNNQTWTITMHEGRNRQIRRTFEALHYQVMKLHRTHFGDYALRDLTIGSTRAITN